MDIAALEDDIVAVLRVAIPDTKVEIVHLPENTADFKRPAVGGARLTVGFNESNFKDPNSLLPVTQPDELCLVVSLLSRTLRSTYGIYTLKKQCEDALLGYVPDNCDMPIVGTYFGPPGPGMEVLNEDVWCFVFHIKTRSMLVQARDITDANFTPSYTPPLTVNPGGSLSDTISVDFNTPIS
jgi:hypothetical protein